MEKQSYNSLSWSDRSSYPLYEDRFNSLLDNGKFYYPAWNHYGRRVVVVCDRCKMSDLDACVGYGGSDLCLMCVEELTKSSRKSVHHCRCKHDHCDHHFTYF